VSVVALSGTSQGEVSVRWSPGPGAPATRFFVVASPGGANATAPADGYPAEVVGLVPGAEYTFTVVAANPAGQSPPSMPTGPVRAKEPAPVDLPPSAPPPPPATRFADCTAEQIQIVFQRTEVFIDNGTVGLFEVRNTSGTACSLEGVPVLQMLDATGDDIYTLWYAAAWMKTRHQTVVNLPASSPPITPHERRSGHAFFWVGWTRRGVCSHGMAGPDRLRATLPINGTSLVISAVAADRSHIGACQNGLQVGPFTATP
jgi:hypothetical protein